MSHYCILSTEFLNFIFCLHWDKINGRSSFPRDGKNYITSLNKSVKYLNIISRLNPINNNPNDGIMQRNL